MRKVTGKTIYEMPLTQLVKDRVAQLAAKEGVPTNLSFHDPDDETLEDSPDDASIAGVDEIALLQEAEEEITEFIDMVNEEDVMDLTEDEECFETRNILNSNEVIVIDDDDDQETVNDGAHIKQEFKQEIVEEELIEAVEETVDDAIEESEQKMAQIQQALEDVQAMMTPPRRSARQRKEVQRLSPSSGEGKFNTSQSYSNAQMKKGARKAVKQLMPDTSERQKKAMCHLMTQGLKPTDTHDQEEAHVLATIMINMVQTHSLKAGIKRFGKKGVDSALKEIRQPHERNCFKPVDVKSMTDQEKWRALELLIFLTEKRDGTIKSRQCANGSIQRNWMTKENAASPTVSLPAVILTSTIDAHEGREVGIVDTPNAFVQTENEGDVVHMKIRGEMVEMLVEMAPEIYKDFVVYEGNRPVLCVQALKALHGMLQSSLLFYKKWVNDIKNEGFELNPCDPCVANKMVNGKQLTLTWHVDDVKVSHVEKKVVDDFIDWVQEKYGQITPVKPSRGKVHDCLAMILNFIKQGKVIVDVRRHVDNLVKKFKCLNELGVAKPKTPAGEHLFKVREDVAKLDQEKAEEFHSVVAAALFVCKRARDDMQPTVSFLCTRVKEPDQDDWKKPLRMLQYLRATKNYVKTLSMDDTGVVKWWADAAFAVHQDMKSHTGGVMSVGEGAAQSISTKQKLTGKSSTEAEIIAANDALLHIMWTKYFLAAQGYEARQTILYQDNTSAILLEKNGKESSSKRTRHINMRYFYIKEKVDNKDIEMQYCPTDEMLGDHMSKPLQGKKFRAFNKAMGIAEMEPKFESS